MNKTEKPPIWTAFPEAWRLWKGEPNMKRHHDAMKRINELIVLSKTRALTVTEREQLSVEVRSLMLPQDDKPERFELILDGGLDGEGSRFTADELERFESADARWEEEQICSDAALRWEAEDSVNERLTEEREYYRSNPNQVRVHAQRARADGDLTLESWTRVLEHFHYECAYCGERYGGLVIEHVYPVVLGGKSNWNNVVPACRRCNAKKRDLHPDVWLQNTLHEAYFVAAVRTANGWAA